jgi:hydroxymethylbilane synthase/uroporphyrinogen III methyltransferase/synthase
MCSSPNSIRVAARASKLSRAQFEELQATIPDVLLEGVFVETHGDLDQSTSLRMLDRTDFFTREVDALVLSGQCQIGLQSAKDLPETIPDGLEIICITQGVDPADSLVLREGRTLEALPPGALIATSSSRREQAVRQLRSDFIFRDVRGTIEQRLSLLESGKADGVVVAEAALIRLKLTHLNRVRLPGPTTPFQGRLAIVARTGDPDMRQLFQPLNVESACAHSI